jgi:hypothetical protein
MVRKSKFKSTRISVCCFSLPMRQKIWNLFEVWMWKNLLEFLCKMQMYEGMFLRPRIFQEWQKRMRSVAKLFEVKLIQYIFLPVMWSETENCIVWKNKASQLSFVSKLSFLPDGIPCTLLNNLLRSIMRVLGNMWVMLYAFSQSPLKYSFEIKFPTLEFQQEKKSLVMCRPFCWKVSG